MVTLRNNFEEGDETEKKIQHYLKREAEEKILERI